MKRLIAYTVVLVVAVLSALTSLPAASAVEVRVELTVSKATFYPPDDGYRDQARFTVHTDRQATVSLQVRTTRTSPVLRVFTLGSVQAGKHVVSWDGRDANGVMVSPGRYLGRAVATVPGHPVQRSDFVAVRMSWKVLAAQSSRHLVTPNTYRVVQGDCGELRQLAEPPNAVHFDMDDPAACPPGSSGKLEAFFRFDDYPTGFTDRDRIIDAQVNVRANGNHPEGFGFLGVQAFNDDAEILDWEWSYDATTGDDGVVEIGAALRHNQPTGRPLRYSFSASVGNDYVLHGFVIDLTWKTLVPAPPE